MSIGAEIVGAGVGTLATGLGGYLVAQSRGSQNATSGAVIGVGLSAAGTVLTALCARAAAQLPRRVNDAIDTQGELVDALERLAAQSMTGERLPRRDNPRARDIVHADPPDRVTRWFVPATEREDGSNRWDKRLVEQSGVYAVRDRDTGEVLYVGSSHTDRLRYTLTRKFQSWPATRDEDPDYSRDPTPYRGAVGHRGSRLLGDPRRVEVRVWYVPADRALDLEIEKRAELVPRYDPPTLDAESDDTLGDAYELADDAADLTFDPTTFKNATSAQSRHNDAAPSRRRARDQKPNDSEGLQGRAHSKQRDSRAKTNPANVALSEASQAVEASTEFHWGDEPERARRVALPDFSQLFEIGKLRELTYETTKGGQAALWEHEFSEPYPSVTATPDGKLGPIVGGAAVVTERGIEG